MAASGTQPASAHPKPVALDLEVDEDEDEEEQKPAVTGGHEVARGLAQPTKRQKLSEPLCEGSQPAVQPVQEARQVAADTKQALGLAGDTSDLCSSLHNQQWTSLGVPWTGDCICT